MKKLLSLVLFAVMVVTFGIGCSSDTAPKKDTAKKDTGTATTPAGGGEKK